MNEDTFNIEIRRYLKQLGITSQREIESPVTRAIQNGRLSGSETLTATMTLEISVLGVPYRLDGQIALQ